MAVVKQKDTLFKITLQASAAPTVYTERVTMAGYKSWVMWLRTTLPTGAPTVTAKIFAVRPEGPASPVPAGDKVQIGSTLTQAGAGLQRGEFGDSEAHIMSGDCEIEMEHAGAVSTITFEVWIELSDREL